MLDSILVWFRRDLRDYDHAALGEALRRARSVYCAFVFDRDILDARCQAGMTAESSSSTESLAELDSALQRRGGGLIVRHARAVDAIPELAQGTRRRRRIRQP
jgi:deoxyribodipyrimidine photo-lyase